MFFFHGPFIYNTAYELRLSAIRTFTIADRVPILENSSLSLHHLLNKMCLESESKPIGDNVVELMTV